VKPPDGFNVSASTMDFVPMAATRKPRMIASVQDDSETLRRS
jgi:hypothetical protein